MEMMKEGSVIEIDLSKLVGQEWKAATGEMTMFNDLWEFSPSKRQWRKLKLPRSSELQGVDGLSAVSFGTSLYVFGGRTMEMMKEGSVIEIDLSKLVGQEWKAATGVTKTAASNWNCPVCTFINKPRDAQCAMCGQAKV
eukprot:TRINITY_DN18347_c0_g2_i2.p1 TRINITY_DN18347_c0_g2~~TRINITY_DN18347_c0_g2_i2.p1  ORF type:complete len:139 (-),score=41.09 TRINITY_DN18347_c0_g2_i2:122-538(-)